MQTLILEAGGTQRHYWKELWTYRDLFYLLAWRDITVRYKQTVIGICWVLIRPAVTMVVFTLVFRHIAGLRSAPGVPYPLLVLCGMLPWQFISSAMSEASMSVVVNSQMLSKIYFPRLIVPTSATISAFLDFAISCGFSVFVFVWYHMMPTWHVLLLPVFITLSFAIALGIGVGLATLNVKYRDFRYIIPFIIQFGIYVSPVGYASSVVDEQWRALYSLNPLVGIIDGFRWCCLPQGAALHLQEVIISFIWCVALLGFGIKLFRQNERNFIDII